MRIITMIITVDIQPAICCVTLIGTSIVQENLATFGLDRILLLCNDNELCKQQIIGLRIG
jgi:hypothetical protein